MRRRRNHEYKLLRRPAHKEDFLAAVQYEMHLDQLRQHRKKVCTIVMYSDMFPLICGTGPAWVKLSRNTTLKQFY